MSTAPSRRLIDLAAHACAPGADIRDFFLVPVDPVVLAVHGAASVVREALDSGRTAHTAADAARIAGTLQTLVLVQQSDTGPCRRWVVDGWCLLRAGAAGADLRGAPLRGAALQAARLGSADLSEADLTGADLEKADLSHTNLTGADLTAACLFSASLQGADLTESALCRADLRHADLRDSTCVRTALRGADLLDAFLGNLDVSTAFTAGVDVDRADFLNGRVVSER
ncbi:pentapeptide repeat-containing protein [Streptomyces sp. N2A]|uniref:pentapeptide repeat-containing protein n=1 Tax=Streptomyces sp. N2A TaxID=3073936 RepID=UPI0028708C2A|nr:pentapeptide repeat-containing protein [Streptomyces sp. N2A]